MTDRSPPPLATTIHLTQGFVAFVSLVDLDLVRQYRWRVQRDNKDTEKFYAVTDVRDGARRRKLYMHRLITGAPAGGVVDHLNHDGLDNTRRNLRVTGFSENMQNCQVVKSRSGFRGVSAAGARWRARIMREGVEEALGVFDTPELAAKAYDRRALDLYGPMAWTNLEYDRGELAEVYDMSDLPF